MDEWIANMWDMCTYIYTHIQTYIHTEMLFSLTKEENPVFSDMDDIGGHYTKFIKPDTETQSLNNLTCTWNFKRWNSKNQRAEWWLLGLKGEGSGRFGQSVQSFSFSKWFSSGDLILSWWLQIIALHYRPETEKAMAPHSSTLAWKIPSTEEPGRLQSMRSVRVRHNWATDFHFSLSCIGEGNGNPLQCSCLENPRDAAWWAAVYEVAPSWTQLKWLSSSIDLKFAKEVNVLTTYTKKITKWCARCVNSLNFGNLSECTHISKHHVVHCRHTQFSFVNHTSIHLGKEREVIKFTENNTETELPWWLSSGESACSAGDVGSIPGSGRSPGEGTRNPLWYSCLGNPMDRGAWWAMVHAVARVVHNSGTKPPPPNTETNCNCSSKLWLLSVNCSFLSHHHFAYFWVSSGP